MADEDRNFSVRENLIRHAAQDDRGNAAAAVRRHDDEIASSLLGGLDNRLMGMILQELRGFALATALSILQACALACSVYSVKAPAIW